MQLLEVLKIRNAYILPPGWYIYSFHPFIRVFLNTCRKVYIHFFYYFVLRCKFIVVLLWESKKFYWIMCGPHNRDPMGITLLKCYLMEQKHFIKVSFISNIHTGENVFCSCYFWRFLSRFFSDRVTKLVSMSLFWICREDKTKWILHMRSELVF